MQFDFDLSFLQNDANGISVWNQSFPSQLSQQHSSHLSKIIDTMGMLSCEAQGLGRPVTGAHLLRGTNHTLYIVRHDKLVKGILKIGYKKLFIHDLEHQYVEMTPLCVLDFYIHDKYQRKGIGKSLFEFMLKSQQIEPRLIAYDAPSPKLLNFLNKYYGLNKYLPQNCNFVVYYDYFSATDAYHYQEPSEIIIPHTPRTASPQKDTNSDSASVEAATAIAETDDHEQKEIQNTTPPSEPEPHTLQYDHESEEKELTWIQNQIERTKLEIAKSEQKIYKQQLDNYVSPYGLMHARKNQCQ